LGVAGDSGFSLVRMSFVESKVLVFAEIFAIFTIYQSCIWLGVFPARIEIAIM